MNILKLLILLFLFTACRAKEEPVTREKLLSKGFILMDQGQYDKAIEYFEELASVDPHYQVKIAWASAYAGRSGVRIEQIYSFTVVKQIPRLEISIGEFSADKKTSELIKHLAVYTEHWKRVPTVSTEKLPDLISAVRILSETTEPGARLYAAALRIVLIKSSVTVGTMNWQVQKQFCSEDIRRFFEWSMAILKELVFLSEDLQTAFPENKKEYEDVNRTLKKIINDVGNFNLPPGNPCF